MIFLQILIYFLAAFFATFGFGVLYNVPQRTLIASSSIGGVSWLVYYLTMTYLNFPVFMATTLASFSIALLSQLMAKRFRVPVIVFAIPAIIPLVPGGLAFNTMRAFVAGEIITAMSYLVETFLTAGALALGLTVNSAIFQVFSPKAIWSRGRRYLP